MKAESRSFVYETEIYASVAHSFIIIITNYPEEFVVRGYPSAVILPMVYLKLTRGSAGGRRGIQQCSMHDGI